MGIILKKALTAIKILKNAIYSARFPPQKTAEVTTIKPKIKGRKIR
jgi:hypothetical protein